ncbi:MAG: AraC family transcriptional regulator [Cellvibrionaceae bacterium]|nr:AraC family transcriptional regulator [Cellvibrionaceae bacterium]
MKPITSDWPLPEQATRFLTPHVLFEWLMENPLTKGLYPVAMGYYPNALGHRMLRPEHDNQLLMYCTAGRGYLRGTGFEQPVQRGDLLAMPRGQAHEYWADEQYPWSLYWLHFDGELADQLMSLICPQQTLAARPIGTQPQLLALFEALFDLRHSATSRTRFIHGCHQTQQLISLLAVLVRQQAESRGKRINMDRVEAYMQQHLHGSFTLDALAEHMRSSKFHFSKKFRQHTGQSPMQYFIQLKMQYACKLLDSSGQSVKAIASNLGYNDPYYFSRLFKKQIGLSPAQYRSSGHR